MGDSIKKAGELKIIDQVVAVEATLINEIAKEAKAKKVSVTYTLQRLKTTIISLNEAKMIKEDEKVELTKIYNNIKNREIGADLEL